ncbi:MAG TPA: hypothetical protein VG892_05620 [Terriglobales bacterium]|jgi:4-amino-4-deoxy-L-arabinose transferase-like glycosyltransferase|nr:hypothetical protein [Terriglobales bacterium]
MFSMAPVQAEAPSSAHRREGLGHTGITLWMAAAAFAARFAAMMLLHTYQFDRLPAVNHSGPYLPFGVETGSIAASIATGHGFSSPFGSPTGPTAWIGPVYPYLLAGIFKLFGLFTTGAAIAALSMNILFAALTCIPLFFLARRTYGMRIALWSGWMWALCPLFFRWPLTWVWEVSLSSLLATLLLALSVRWAGIDVTQAGGMDRANRDSLSDSREAILLGAVSGLCILVNPALLIVVGLCILWACRLRKRQSFNSARPVLLIVLSACAVLAPWMVRNRVVFGRPVFVRSNFWVEFALGNYHLSNATGWGGKHPTVNVEEFKAYKKMGELAYVESKKVQSLKFLREFPGEFVTLSLNRILIFWNGDAYFYQPRDAFIYMEAAIFSWVSIAAGLGLLLSAGRGKQAGILFLAIALFYPAVYYITYSQPRYRHAIEPMMLIAIVYFMREIRCFARTRLRSLFS